MDSEPPPPPGDLQREFGTRTRRRVVLIGLTVLVVWAIVATAALLWIVTTSQGPSQLTVWASDSWLIVQLDWSTGSAASALAAYLVTHNANFSDAALNWSVQSWDTVRYGKQYGPGGFPSASALNLSDRTFGCTYYALVRVRSYLDEIPGAWSAPGSGPYTMYLASAESAFYNLSSDFRGAGTGLDTDPLVQLGPARVASIRENASALFALSQPWGMYAPGSDCGP